MQSVSPGRTGSGGNGVHAFVDRVDATGRACSSGRACSEAKRWPSLDCTSPHCPVFCVFFCVHPQYAHAVVGAAGVLGIGDIRWPAQMFDAACIVFGRPDSRMATASWTDTDKQHALAQMNHMFKIIVTRVDKFCAVSVMAGYGHDVDDDDDDEDGEKDDFSADDSDVEDDDEICGAGDQGHRGQVDTRRHDLHPVEGVDIETL